jgi:hypothetical protein
MTERKLSQQSVLYSIFSERLAKDGISRQEIESLKDFPIGHQSVAGFVEANVKLGNFEWRQDTLVNASQRLSLRFTRNEEKKLKEKAQEAGLTTKEYASQILLGVISQQ